MYLFSGWCRSTHHPLQTELGCRAQPFSVFFYDRPEFITFDRGQTNLSYEMFIHLFGMLGQILQQSSNGIPVVAGDTLDATDTISFYKELAYLDYI